MTVLKILSGVLIVLAIYLYGREAHAGLISQPTRYYMTNGLVGYWSFDGPDVSRHTKITTLDRSGNGNLGYITSATSSPLVAGKLGQAQQFDGSDDYVDAGDPANDSLDFGTEGDFSIFAWVKGDIIASGVGEEIVAAKYPSGVNAGYNLSIDANQVHAFVRDGTGSGATEFVDQYSASTLKPGVWYHIGMTVKRTSSLTVYVNGIAEGSADPSTLDATISNTTGFAIGKSRGGSAINFDGAIDEVRVYNRALTPDEIKRLYASGTSRFNAPQTSKITNGLVGYWTFDGTDIATHNKITVLDRSGNGSLGYIRNATTTPPSTTGVLGQAMNFDGSNDWINITSPSSALAITGDITISAWIYVKDTSCENPIITKHKGGTNFDYELYLSGATTMNFTGTVAVVSASIPNLLNRWHHVVVTRSGSIVTFYDGGTQLGNTGTDSGTFTNTAGAAVDFSCDGGACDAVACSSSLFKGKMDEVRVYNRGLTADEVKRLYNMGASRFNAPQTSKITGGLVGYWTFDGPDVSKHAKITVMDRSGSGNLGFITYATSAPLTNGKLGQAQNFDGVDDYVRVPDSSSLGLSTTITLSAWVRPNAIGSTYKIIAKWDDGTAQSFTYLLSVLDTGLVEFDLRKGDNSDWLLVLDSVTSLKANQWTHIVGTYDGAIGKVYVDGVLNASSAASGSFRTSNVPLTIGSGINISGDTRPNLMNGSIDEARIYNRALTPDEIKRLYNIGKVGN